MRTAIAPAISLSIALNTCLNICLNICTSIGMTIAMSLGFTFAVPSAAAAVTAATVPETVTVGEGARKQPPVVFGHAKHAALAKSCDVCHHTQKGLKKGDAKVAVSKCSSCHLDPKTPVPSMREMSLQKNPMHVRCLACHKEMKKGPVACAGCHVKK